MIQEKLRVGAHTRRLHNGMPVMQGGLNNLMPNSMDGLPIVPGMTINFRVLEPAKVLIL